MLFIIESIKGNSDKENRRCVCGMDVKNKFDLHNSYITLPDFDKSY